MTLGLAEHLRQQFAKNSDEITALRLRIRELEEALRPFAQARIDDPYEDPPSRGAYAKARWALARSVPPVNRETGGYDAL